MRKEIPFDWGQSLVLTVYPSRETHIDIRVNSIYPQMEVCEGIVFHMTVQARECLIANLREFCDDLEAMEFTIPDKYMWR